MYSNDLRALAKKFDVKCLGPKRWTWSWWYYSNNNNSRVIDLHLMLWNEEFETYNVSHMGL